MCGIAGFANFTREYLPDSVKWRKVLEDMNRVQKYRGPDEDGIFLASHCGMGHVRLSIIDLKSGQQPMMRRQGGAAVPLYIMGKSII